LFVVVVIVLTLVSASAAFAQTVPLDPAPSVRNCTALAISDAPAYIFRVGGSPLTAALRAVYICTGFNRNLVGNTTELFNASCGSEIIIYKVDNHGQQGLWNIPGRSCAGDALTLVTEGTGHYAIYTIESAQVASLPPIIRGGA